MTGLACFVTNMASTPIASAAADPAAGSIKTIPVLCAADCTDNVPLSGEIFLMMSSDAVFTCTRPRVTMPAIRIAGQQSLGSNANVHHEVLDRRQSSFHAPAFPPSPPSSRGTTCDIMCRDFCVIYFSPGQLFRRKATASPHTEGIVYKGDLWQRHIPCFRQLLIPASAVC